MKCIDCGNSFESTLHYTSPAHGGWGVVRMGHLLPESYQLFVSPAACGRHGAVGACLQGRKDRVSYLYLSEEDIVSGDYEQLILDGAAELLDWLSKRGRTPKVLMIFVSCIDDLLGTDHDALVWQLSEMYPEIRFTFCHMNPTSLDTGVPPPVNIQNKMYELLDVREKDNGVNLIGGLTPLVPGSECYELLPAMGAFPVRDITACESFEKFQEMAGSRLNIVTGVRGIYSASQMQKKHGTPMVRALTSYRIEEVSDAYRRIAEALSSSCPDLSPWEEKCRSAFEEARALIGDTEIVLDGDAVFAPFGLTRALLTHGFSCRRVIAQQIEPNDRENYEWVRANLPGLEIQQPQHHRAVLFDERVPGCLAIGYNSGYITGSRHVVPLEVTTGHWGYGGILDMLRMLREAASEETDLKEMIARAGLVV